MIRCLISTASLIALLSAPVSGAGAADLPAGVGLTDPTLAYGLWAISDFSTEMPFLDITHYMRPWIGHSTSAWSAMSYGQLEAGGYLDANGWLTHMPDGLTSVGTIWSWSNSTAASFDGAAGASRAGTYVLTYEGDGTIKLGGSVTVISSEPGRIVFSNATGASMTMDITATDPRGTGDYIRDIHVVDAKYEGLYQAGEIFNPDFLATIQDARELRFMDWMHTNNSTLSNWADRPQLGDATWMGQGVPVEVLVQLANQTGADPWFNMPVQASDDYIRQFATYVRDHLDPGLVAHVEYSNENWNWSFDQATWLAAQAKAVWGNTGQSDNTNMLNYAGMRAAQVAMIWDQVFGAQADTRVDNVLGAQTGSTWGVTQELTAPLWQTYDPAGYVAPHTVFDSLAVTTYFGSSMVANADLRTQLLDAINNPNVDAVAWLTQELTDPNVPQSIPNIIKSWGTTGGVAQKYGLNLIAYEGGQHVQQAFAISGLSQTDLGTLTTFLTGYIRSDTMASLYQQLWDAWAKVSDGPFMQFGDVAAPSQYGSWGLFAALGDSNPRANLLTLLNDTAASWFGDGGGTQYQQGVIRIAGNTGEVLTGTAKQDFLVGGSGNDTLRPGTGSDGLNGGPGIDTVMLPGTADQYRLVVEGKGYRLTGPKISDYVVNVEKFSFEGGGAKTLAEMLKG